MKLKKDVRVIGLKTEMVPALMVAQFIYDAHGHELTITSVTDGQHSTGSLHYTGCAFDCRTVVAGIEIGEATMIADAIRERLTGDYDVVVEPTHIHIEYQPKSAY